MSRQGSCLPAGVTATDLGVSNLSVWDMEPYCTILEHDTGDRHSGSAQRPNTLMGASVTLLMTVLLNLDSQAGEQKETMGVLFRRRKDLILCLRSPRGLIRRDESTEF